MSTNPSSLSVSFFLEEATSAVIAASSLSFLLEQVDIHHKVTSESRFLLLHLRDWFLLLSRLKLLQDQQVAPTE